MSAPYRILLGGRGVAHLPKRPSQENLDVLVKLWLGVTSINGASFDLTEIKDASILKAIDVADSVALVCSSSQVTSKGSGKWELSKARTGLIKGQHFAEQDAVPDGQTGFLVGDDLLLTTVHDLDVKKVPKNQMVVFDFKVDSAGQVPATFTDSQVFRISKVEDYGTYPSPLGDDWLLLRLAAKTGRSASVLTVSASQVPVGTSLWMIGHPLGLPMKFVGKASVKSVGAYVFESDLDACEGNSGSIVVDASTNRIAGVLRHAADGTEGVGRGLRWWWCPSSECPTEVTNCTRFHAAVSNPPAWPFARKAARRMLVWLGSGEPARHVKGRGAARL